MSKIDELWSKLTAELSEANLLQNEVARLGQRISRSEARINELLAEIRDECQKLKFMKGV
jgi:chaperonin cofactor prefoldin